MQPVNMTEKIRGILEDMIFRGKLRAGEQLESNSELAKRFGVSTLTADRAVRLLVNEGLVYRKQGVGTFVAERNAPKNGPVCRIGVADTIFPAAPEWESAMGIRTRSGIQYLYSKQCEVKMLDYPTVCDPGRLAGAVTGLDGILAAAGFIDPVSLGNLKKLSIPIVVTQLEEEKDIPFHQVMVDNRIGIREAAEKIIRKNYPEIVIVYESHPNGLLRKKVFEECMISGGYSPDRIRSYCVETDALFNGIPSYRLGLKLCAKIKGKFLFSTSDVVSFSMLEAFREKGLKAGADFQLLSYDNLEDYEYRPYKSPYLTTIDSPKVRQAERAAELLLEQIRRKSDETVLVRIPTRLIIRETAFRQMPRGSARREKFAQKTSARVSK